MNDAVRNGNVVYKEEQTENRGGNLSGCSKRKMDGKNMH